MRFIFKLPSTRPRSFAERSKGCLLCAIRTEEEESTFSVMRAVDCDCAMEETNSRTAIAARDFIGGAPHGGDTLFRVSRAAKWIDTKRAASRLARIITVMDWQR